MKKILLLACGLLCLCFSSWLKQFSDAVSGSTLIGVSVVFQCVCTSYDGHVEEACRHWVYPYIHNISEQHRSLWFVWSNLFTLKWEHAIFWRNTVLFAGKIQLGTLTVLIALLESAILSYQPLDISQFWVPYFYVCFCIFPLKCTLLNAKLPLYVYLLSSLSIVFTIYNQIFLLLIYKKIVTWDFI